VEKAWRTAPERRGAHIAAPGCKIFLIGGLDKEWRVASGQKWQMGQWQMGAIIEENRK
jgi:hypothetical protein